VGAAPIQNIGAYGVEVKDLIESVQVVEIDSGKQKRFSNADCRFGYRDSIFKHELKGKVIILNVTFRLAKVVTTHGTRSIFVNDNQVFEPDFLNLDYGEIRSELVQMTVERPGIGDVREAVCSIRRRKLPDPAVAGNAGSFFKNPVIGAGLLTSLQVSFPGIPSHHVSPVLTGNPDMVKIPAAWLIDQCGWKGYRSGDAGVHPNQPLVLVNYGNATGKEILELSKQIVDSVRQKFGITLEREVHVIE
jgi:UDP-N-acetylmuramate dehydrogenase